MDKEEHNKTTEEKQFAAELSQSEDEGDLGESSVYPTPTKGTLSEDHSAYGAPKQWAGGDPDKNTKAYFIAFLIVMGILFIFAVKSLSGGNFFL